jgi:hypothetical protein
MDLLTDHRDINGVAGHFNMTVKYLEIVLDY